MLKQERKENPLDFAFEAAKEGEVLFRSAREGTGRLVGIECSVMATEIAGIDIHGGGQTLEFPRHTNEIAFNQKLELARPSPTTGCTTVLSMWTMRKCQKNHSR